MLVNLRTLGVVAVSAAMLVTSANPSQAAVPDGVIAWGHRGQAAVPAEARSGVTAIAASGNGVSMPGHSLALKNTRVLAWGRNEAGQTDVPVEARSGVAAIAAGPGFSLALKRGRAITWGGLKAAVPAEASSGVTAIAAGGLFGLALKNGRVLALGDNAHGQTRLPAGARSGVHAIAAGGRDALAVSSLR